jgi:hypothetical protein
MYDPLDILDPPYQKISGLFAGHACQDRISVPPGQEGDAVLTKNYFAGSLEPETVIPAKDVLKIHVERDPLYLIKCLRLT